MKLILTIFLVLITLELHCQDIDREYSFKQLDASFFKKLKSKLSGKGEYNYTDKIILHTDGTFFRKIFATNGTFISYEDLGTWKEKNDTLFMYLNRFRIPESGEAWTEFQRIYIFYKTKLSIMPVYNGQVTKDQEYKLKGLIDSFKNWPEMLTRTIKVSCLSCFLLDSESFTMISLKPVPGIAQMPVIKISVP
jgi:hypothetical protein